MAKDRQFPDVKHSVAAVDGTVVKTLSRIVQAAYLRSPTDGRSMSAWRLHTHVDVERGLPVCIDITGAGSQGDNDERAVLRQTPQADTGYAQFALFNAIATVDSSYVCCVRDNSVYEVVEQRPLSAEATAAPVSFDAVVRRGQDRKPGERPEHPLRLIFIQTTPHPKRGKAGGGTSGPRSDGVLRIATNLLDVPAEVIGFLYQRRRLIEIFFRFLKHILGCGHLLSTHPAGVDSSARRHHRLSVDRAVDRQAADQADPRDDLLLFHPLGRRGGTASAFAKLNGHGA